MEARTARILYNQMCWDGENAMARFGVAALANGAPTYASPTDERCEAAAKFLRDWAEALNTPCR